MQGQAYGNQTGSLAKAQDKSILAELCEQISKEISGIDAGHSSIDTAMRRLVNPRPADTAVAEVVSVPQPNTLESELQAILRKLRDTRQNVQTLANVMQSAV